MYSIPILVRQDGLLRPHFKAKIGHLKKAQKSDALKKNGSKNSLKILHAYFSHKRSTSRGTPKEYILPIVM